MRPQTAEIKNAELVLFKALQEYVEILTTETAKRVVAQMMAEERERDADPPEQPVVYFIQGIEGGAIKIGVAVNPLKRMAELQRTSPVALVILATEPGGYQREKQLHQQFAEWRLHGEWFEDCAGLVAYVSALTPIEESVT